MACGAPSAPTLEQQERRLIQMIDERRFSDAILMIEERSPPEAQTRFQPYLAQAYLGRSGFLPMEFAANVLGAQSEAQEGVDRLIPNCARETLSTAAALDLRCVLWRLFRHLPTHDAADFARARTLLREQFADPKKTSSGYNALAGVVELASLLSALREALLLAQAQDPSASLGDETVRAILADVHAAAGYAQTTLARAKWVPYFNLSQQLTGLERDTILQGGPIDWQYVEQTGIPLLLRLSSPSAGDLTTRVGRGILLARLREFTAQLGVPGR
jgi:hypothetical protein